MTWELHDIEVRAGRMRASRALRIAPLRGAALRPAPGLRALSRIRAARTRPAHLEELGERDALLEMAAQYDVPYSEDVDAALTRDDVQMVSVCTEPTRHARLATRAALAGKHVLVDKPMATTLADADAAP